MYTMTTSNSKQTQALATFITFFLLLLLNKVKSSSVVSFSINKFSPKQQDLYFEGDAFVSKGILLHVTDVDENDEPLPWSVGRATYSSPVQIWDNTTGQIASFTTSFSFAVKAPNENASADGLAFFLGPYYSEIPSNWQPRWLGLFNSTGYDSSYQIVAAEFDTYFYRSFWDPDYRHIGIDVNEIKSISTAIWDWRNGEVANVVITYHAPTKTLSISLVQPFSQTSSIVTGKVDLKEVLPEYVEVGFSAASAQKSYEAHDVLSWSFQTYWESSDTYASIKNDDMHVAVHTV